MTDTSRRMLRDTVIPVLLGSGREAYLLSAKIFIRFGIRPYLCSHRGRLLSLICPTAQRFPLYSADDFEIQLKSLEYIADAQEYLPVLIPCTEHFRAAVTRNTERLESRFIIAYPETLFETKPFADMARKGRQNAFRSDN